jgi:hypothetical protein
VTKKKSAGEVLRTRILREAEPSDIVGEVLLDAICREADLVEALEIAIAKDGVVIDGARGQRIQHPAIAGLARHRKLLVDLTAQAFPEERESVTSRARRAARTRWTNEGVRR